MIFFKKLYVLCFIIGTLLKVSTFPAQIETLNEYLGYSRNLPAGPIASPIIQSIEEANDIDVDGSDYYVVGVSDKFTNPVETSYLCGEIYVQRYNSDGKAIWTRSFGEEGSESDQGMAIEACGDNVYVVGTVNDKSTGNNKLYILKLTKHGEKIDDTHYEETGYQTYGMGLDVYKDKLYITGYRENSSNVRDVLLLKYDLNLNPDAGGNYPVSWDGGNDDVGYSICCSKYKVYITGITQVLQGYDVLLLKYNLDGDLQWGFPKKYDNSNIDVGNAITVYNSNIYITGYRTNTSTPGIDMLLLRYNTRGSLIWDRFYGNVDMHEGMDVKGYGGYVYVTGYTNDGSGSGDQAFVRQYGARSGNVYDHEEFGGTGEEGGHAIDIYNSRVYIAGKTTSYGAGLEDALMLKYHSNLDNLYWYKTWGASLADFLHKIQVYDGYQYEVGRTWHYGIQSWDVLVNKRDLDGNLIWSVTDNLVGPSTDFHENEAWDLHVNESGLFLTGRTNSNSPDNFTQRWDILIQKYQLSDGSRIWSETFDNGPIDGGLAITGDDDSLFIACEYFDISTNFFKLLVLKYDMNGNYGRHIVFPGTNPMAAKDIDISDNSIYITGGTRPNFPSGEWDVFLIKYSTALNLIWDETYDEKFRDVGWSLTIVQSCTYPTWEPYTDYDHLDRVQWLGFVYQCDVTYGESSTPGREPDNPVMWRVWDKIGPVTGGEDHIYIGGDQVDTYVNSLLLKYHEDGGDPLWKKSWGGYPKNSVTYGIVMADSKIFAVGATCNFGEEINAFVLEYELDGEESGSPMIWGNYRDDWNVSIDYYNGHLYIGGYTESYGIGDIDFFYRKMHTSTLGTVHWTDWWGSEK